MKAKGGKAKKHLAIFLALALIFATFLGDVGVLQAETGNELSHSLDSVEDTVPSPELAMPEPAAADPAAGGTAAAAVDPAAGGTAAAAVDPAAGGTVPEISEEPVLENEQYAAIEEFTGACEAVGDAADLDSVLAALAHIESIYARLSPDDQAAVSEEWAYIQAYGAEVRAGNPDEDIDTMALLTHEKFSIKVNIGYLNGNEFIVTGSKTVIGTCKDSTGHSGFNHSMDPNEILAEAGYPGSSYRVTSYSNWGAPASTTRVTYNITGSAPYKADQAFWIIGEPPTTEPGTPGGDGNGGGSSGNESEDIGSGSKYTWTETIIYHANYPGGNDPQIKVTYTVRSFTSIYNGSPKSYRDCGFTVPDGYELKNGWYNQDGSYNCSFNNFTFSYAMRNKTTHLYAQYTPMQAPLNTFSMTYHANGGTVEGKSSHTIKIETSDTSYAFHSLEPVRKGYTFEGWYDRSSGGSMVSWPQTLTVSANTKTVYAHWSKIKSVDATVIYIPGEGTGQLVTETVPGSVLYTIKGSNAVGFIAPAGKIFSHWTNQDQNNYAAGDEFTPADGSCHVFTAIWKDEDIQTGNASYKVQWFDNHGTAIKSDEIRRGTAGEPVFATPEDKNLIGYKYNSSDPRNVDSAILKADHSTVLKLYFTALLTVTWVDEDGKTVLDGPRYFEHGTEAPAAETYEGREPAKKDSEDFTYAFKEWVKSTDSDGNVIYKATYTATPIEKVTVTWVDEDGTELHKLTGVKKSEIPKGDRYKDYSGKENPTKPEDQDFTYTFKEWAKTTDPDGNVTYTAVYTPTPKDVDPNPVDPDPVDPNPVDPNPVDPNPVDPSPVDPNPVNPNPVNPNPVNPNPVSPNPGTPSLVDPNPVNPAPVIPNPAIPAVTPTTPVVTPTAPAAPVAVPVAQAAQTPEAEQPVEIADAQTPLASAQTPAADEDAAPANEEEILTDEEVPLTLGNGGRWALMNFALMNLAIFASIMLLIGYFVKPKNEDEKEDEQRKLKKKGIIRVLSIPVAVISLIAFILTEDITLPTGFVDQYTIWMAIIAILQTVMIVLSHKKYQKEEERA